MTSGKPTPLQGDRVHPADDARLRVLVVSHACTVGVNRDVYRSLSRAHGHDVHLVVPRGWPAAFAGTAAAPLSSQDADLSVTDLPVRLPGRIQQHFYRWANIRAVLRTIGPDVLLVEEEPVSFSGTQWGAVATRMGIPYALQNAENLAGRTPSWWRPVVKRNLRGAGLVMARSHSAVTVAQNWGAAGTVEFLPHALPNVLVQEGQSPPSAPAVPSKPELVIGFAGRLVAEKGITFLVDVLIGLDAPVPIRLLVAGRGPEDHELDRLSASGVEVERMTLPHDQMAEFYSRLDVLVVPSRTTPTWTEQFGRVITEAACFGVPTIGSDSGEIPWVIGDLGAGQVVPEDDASAWREALLTQATHSSFVARAELRATVLERYSTQAVAARLDAALSEWVGRT